MSDDEPDYNRRYNEEDEDTETVVPEGMDTSASYMDAAPPSPILLDEQPATQPLSPAWNEWEFKDYNPPTAPPSPQSTIQPEAVDIVGNPPPAGEPPVMTDVQGMQELESLNTDELERGLVDRIRSNGEYRGRMSRFMPNDAGIMDFQSLRRGAVEYEIYSFNRTVYVIRDNHFVDEFTGTMVNGRVEYAMVQITDIIDNDISSLRNYTGNTMNATNMPSLGDFIAMDQKEVAEEDADEDNASIQAVEEYPMSDLDRMFRLERDDNTYTTVTEDQTTPSQIEAEVRKVLFGPMQTLNPTTNNFEPSTGQYTTRALQDILETTPNWYYSVNMNKEITPANRKEARRIDMANRILNEFKETKKDDDDEELDEL